MSKKRTVSSRDTRLAKAMAHPVRVQALSILNERVASPSDIAAEIGLPVANVAYHVRALLQLDCIEEVETRQVRGALEHRYRAIRRAFLKPDEWEALPANAREGMAGVWFESAFRDVVSSMSAGVFEDRTDRHLSYTPLVLDQAAWEQLNKRALEFLNAAMELQAEAAVRLRDGEIGGPEVRSRLTIMHYEASTKASTKG
jgi:DNA-binding transcriptional ArsR family regulator